LPEARESLGKIGIFLAQNSIFLARNSIFLARFPTFLNGFPIFLNGFPTFFKGFLLSAMPFCFPQHLSAFRNTFLIFINGFPIFLNSFPLSKKSKKIYLQRQVYERSLFQLRISSHSLPELCSLCYYVYISPNTLLWCTCVPNSAPNLN
jgi:hypothetical protein